MDRTYEDIWYKIKEDLIDLSRWTPTISVPKLIEKMDMYECLIEDSK